MSLECRQGQDRNEDLLGIRTGVFGQSPSRCQHQRIPADHMSLECRQGQDRNRDRQDKKIGAPSGSRSIELVTQLRLPNCG